MVGFFSSRGDNNSQDIMFDIIMIAIYVIICVPTYIFIGMKIALKGVRRNNIISCLLPILIGVIWAIIVNIPYINFISLIILPFLDWLVTPTKITLNEIFYLVMPSFSILSAEGWIIGNLLSAFITSLLIYLGMEYKSFRLKKLSNNKIKVEG